MRPGEMPLASRPLMMALAMAPAPMKPMFRLCRGDCAAMALMLFFMGRQAMLFFMGRQAMLSLSYSEAAC